MKPEMLQSQFNTLEIPQADEPGVFFIDIDGSFEEVVERCVETVKPLI